MILIISYLSFDSIYVLEIIERQPSATCWILQNDELRDNLNFTQTKYTNSHQGHRLNWANMNEKILSYQEWDPLSIRRSNSWDYVPIWNWDSQISSFISKWCIWDSSNVIDQSQMNSPHEDLKHVQEQSHYARMQFKEFVFYDSKIKCKHFHCIWNLCFIFFIMAKISIQIYFPIS